MKKLLFLPLLAAITILASCSPSDDGPSNPNPGDPVTTSVDYYGVLNIGNVADTVRCTVVYNNAANVAELKINGFQFNDTLPAINMRVAGIICTLTSTDIVFAMDDVVPEISEKVEAGNLSKPGVSDTRYTMSDFTGIIKDKTMEFTAKMSMGDVEFIGAVVPLFAGDMQVIAAGDTQKVNVEDVQCEIELDGNGMSANLIMYGAKFAANMPKKVDIRLEGVKCNHFHGGYNVVLSDTLVPMVRVAGATDFVPMSAYAFTSLNGEVLDEGSLNFDALMTRGYISYYGDRFIKVVNQ
ncbi:MAG: hypothetical protein IKY37_06820 [Bacteroidaceae bacterium]|nr:hypothetical protein [Bacteroidaceae bacterium]